MSFSPLATTKMACQKYVMAQEHVFLDAMGRVSVVRDRRHAEQLTLFDASGATLLVSRARRPRAVGRIAASAQSSGASSQTGSPGRTPSSAAAFASKRITVIHPHASSMTAYAPGATSA